MTLPSANLPPSQLLDSLPMYPPIAEPKFVWGTTDSVSFIHLRLCTGQLAQLVSPGGENPTCYNHTVYISYLQLSIIG